eukprot:scaffold36667_cov88-Skeletonema_marinoi.AAC.1
METRCCWHFDRCTLPSYIDKGEASIILLALQPLHTTSYIDKDGKMVLLALQPLHNTSYIDKDGKIVLLALQPLQTTSYVDKGEASIIANRGVVS